MMVEPMSREIKMMKKEGVGIQSPERGQSPNDIIAASFDQAPKRASAPVCVGSIYFIRNLDFLFVLIVIRVSSQATAFLGVKSKPNTLAAFFKLLKRLSLYAFSYSASPFL